MNNGDGVSGPQKAEKTMKKVGMKNVRMILDTLMVVLLPLLMAYSLIGENIHEVIGLCMFALFIGHHIINRKWWTSLFKGKYNASRTLSTIINLLLAVYMLLQPISGVLMSKYVLKDITLNDAAGILRMIHMTVAYWGFVLMSLHLGLHVRAISAMIGKKFDKRIRTFAMIAFLLIAVYGIYAFIHRNIGDYLMMKVMFAFFDFGEPRIRFLVDYLAVMVLGAEIAYWIQKTLMKTATEL